MGQTLEQKEKEPDSMPLISVIIPVYNSKLYLQRCLESVSNQTYTNFECVVVNDGSTDGCAEICDQWAEKDKRFKIIHQINKGVSAARNSGLRESVGEYICFVDSDDWVDSHYLSVLCDAIGGADMALCGLWRDRKDCKSEQVVPKKTSLIELNEGGADAFVDLNRKLLLYPPFVKLLRSSIVKKNQIRFLEDVSYGEDLLFNYEYLENVNTISCVSLPLYHYSVFESGTLSSSFRPDQFEVDYRQWVVLRLFYEKRGLWTDCAKELLYERLWGILYDGLFLYPQLSPSQTGHIARILSIPEIEELRDKKHLFLAAWWIKWAILHRAVWAFKLLFMLNRNTCKVSV